MKKGETRNPNGRPKGAKGTKAMTRKVLSTKTTIKDGSVTRKVTLYHALLLKEVQAAFSGDWRARRTVLELGRWALPEEGSATSETDAADPARDDEILDWFKEEILAQAAAREEEQ